MKIKEIIIKNFKNVAELKTKFGGGINYIIGSNKQGKTSVIDSIITGFQGKKAIPDYMRQDMIKEGAKKSVLKFEVEDQGKTFKFQRSITKSGINLSGKGPEGEKITEAFLKEKLSPHAFNPFELADQTPKKQIETVQQILGIDTSEIDKKIKELENERLIIGRLIPSEPEEVDRVDYIDTAETVKNYQDFSKLVKSYFSLIRGKTRIEETISTLEDELNETQVLIANAEECLNIKPQDFEAIKNIKAEKEKEIECIDNQNQKAHEYKTYCEKMEFIKTKETEYKELTKQIEQEKEKRKNMIENADKPFKNIGFDDRGMLVGDKPFNSHAFSTSEIIRIAAMLFGKGKGELKTMIIPRGESLDPDMIKEISGISGKYNIQFIIEFMGGWGKPDGGYQILLEENNLK